MFIKDNAGIFVALIIYVDYIILASNNVKAIQDVKNYLNICFSIKDLGKLKFILGLEIARKYTLDLLAKYGFVDCKPAPTPITTEKADFTKTGKLPYNTEYMKLIGKLLYLLNTRPDISYAVQQLSQFLDNPLEAYLTAAHRILRYLKGNPAQGILYSTSSDYKLKAYSDSDWENYSEIRKSVTGYTVFIGDSLISWKSKK